MTTKTKKTKEENFYFQCYCPELPFSHEKGAGGCYYQDLPDSEQGVKDYHKWNKRGVYYPNQAMVRHGCIGFLLGFVVAIILFNSAIISVIQ